MNLETFKIKESDLKGIDKLKALLDKHKDKRVVVLGTTCTGKSTFLKFLPDCEDMDRLIFPLLNDEEKEFVCQTPWTEQIGDEMLRFTKERVKIKVGKPVFGTILLDSDVIIYLDISDDLLRKRVKSRGKTFNDAKNMQKRILGDISNIDRLVERISIG